MKVALAILVVVVLAQAAVLFKMTSTAAPFGSTTILLDEVCPSHQKAYVYINVIEITVECQDVSS